MQHVQSAQDGARTPGTCQHQELRPQQQADTRTVRQDGSISEAVAWECPPHERHLILDRILQHVLPRHLDGTVLLHSHSALLGSVLAPGSFPPAAQHAAFRCWQMWGTWFNLSDPACQQSLDC